MAQSLTSRHRHGHHPRQGGEGGPRRAQQTLAMLRQKQLQIEFKLEGTPYRPVNNIGTGAYGVVCSAVDTRTERKVAIKKIPKAFGALTLIKRTLREVQILRHFRHENIVAVLDMFQADGTYGNDVYMVMDLMETDLHQIIHSRQSLSEQHLQYFMYQILRGLKYIHSAGVIHRDLKPSNLLVNADCLLKIGDFGMARSLGQAAERSGPMTQYVATRWYRAPELVFSMLDYTTQVDLWSVGCIFAELIMRRQLFPGKDHVSQLKLIVSFLGTPGEEIMERISSDIVKTLITSMGHCEPLPWASILPKASPTAIDLIHRMMQIAPWQRISAEESLGHDYLEAYHDPELEPVCSKHVVLETDNIESLEPEELKSALEASVTHFADLHSRTIPDDPKPDTPEVTPPAPKEEAKEKPVKEDTVKPRVLADVEEETGEKDIHMISAKMSANLLEDEVGEEEPAQPTDSGLNSMSEPEASQTPEPKAQEEMELVSEINEDILGEPSTSHTVMPHHFPRPRPEARRVIQHTDTLLRRRESAREEAGRPVRKRPNSLNEEQADLVRRIFSNALTQSRMAKPEAPPELAVFRAPLKTLPPNPKPDPIPDPVPEPRNRDEAAKTAEAKEEPGEPIGIKFFQPSLDTKAAVSSMETTPVTSARPLYAIKAVSADGRQQIFQPTVVEVNLALEDARVRQAAAEVSVVARAAAPATPSPVRLTQYRTINAFGPSRPPPRAERQVTHHGFGVSESQLQAVRPRPNPLSRLEGARASASLSVREPRKPETDPRTILRTKLVAKKDNPVMEPSLVTAHERRLEREEKKKRREHSKKSPTRPSVVTEHDRLLAERWGQMERQSEANAIQGEIGDLISETVSSGKGAEGLDSSNLMSTWVEASQMDPEVLLDLEKEIHIH